MYIFKQKHYREHKENINLFFVRGTDNAMIPLTSLGTTSYTTGPGSIKRFNMFNSSVILGEAADGYSSGQAMEIIEQIAREHLPENIGVEWSGLSFQEKQAGGTDRHGAGISVHVRIFVPCCLIRKLDGTGCSITLFACSRIRCLSRCMGLWTGE